MAHVEEQHDEAQRTLLNLDTAPHKVPDGVIDLLKAAQGAIRLDRPNEAHGYIGAVLDVLTTSQEQERAE